MKYIAWIGSLLSIFIVIVYVIAFTPVGNSILKPILEGKIKEQTKLDSKLSSFSLTMSDFAIILEIDKNNIIYIDGKYSLFSQIFDISYKLRMKSLESLKPLTNAPLRGVFSTDGTLKGDLNFIQIDGISDVAKSDMTYHIELTQFQPTSIIANVKDADLISLLYIAGQSSYASADINLDINFKNITPHALDGNILLQTKNGLLNSAVMKKDFNLSIPRTAFSMNLDAKLDGDDIDYEYLLNSNLAMISSSGKVTPEPLKTDIKYGVDIKELAVLKPITNAPLRGAFKTAGTLKGTKESMLIDGKSNIGGSKTTYKIDLKEFKPKSILATIKGAKVAKLLYMVGEPNYASSDLNADIKLTSLDPKNLAGYMDVRLNNGLLNSKIMKKTYKVNIPKTTFYSNIHVDLKGEDIDYKLAFTSNLAKLSSAGHIVPDSMAMDLKYGVDIKELAVLKPITGADIRGALKIDGIVKGDKERLVVNGKSDFASSDTTFVATLKDFTPLSVKAKIKNLKLSKVLYMVKQPHYADGIFSLDLDILDARDTKLKGNIASKITDGLVDSKYMTKSYEFKTPMPKTTFKLSTNTMLDGNIADTKVDFDSTLANLDIKQARMNLKDSSLVSDYILKVPSLDKLFFATDRHMRGSISANGELRKAKDLDLTIHSKIAGGKIDATLHNDDFHADLFSIKTIDALHILIYPEIFKAKLNGKLDYNLATQKGDFNAKLLDGKFAKNSMFGLLKKYTKVDLYKEKFKGNVNADINKEKIIASLDLKSRTSSIVTKNTKLNSKTKKIDSILSIVANKHPVTIKLKGNVNEPKISIDLEKLMNSKTGDVLKQKASKLLNKLFK